MILDAIKTPDQVTANFQNRIVVATGHRPDKCGETPQPPNYSSKNLQLIGWPL